MLLVAEMLKQVACAPVIFAATSLNRISKEKEHKSSSAATYRLRLFSDTGMADSHAGTFPSDADMYSV